MGLPVQLQSRLLAAFVLVLALVSAVAAVGFRAAERSRRAADAVETSWQALHRTEVARGEMFEVAAAYHAYFASGNPAFRLRCQEQLASLRAALRAPPEVQGKGEREDDSSRKLRLRAAERVEAWAEEFIQPAMALRDRVTAATAPASLLAATVGSDTSAAYLDDVDQMLLTIAAAERAALADHRRADRRAARWATNLTRGGAATSGLLLCGIVLVGLGMARSIGRRAGAVARLLDLVAGRGELRLRVGDRTPDELGAMARALDQVLERLAEIIGGLVRDSSRVGAAAGSLAQLGGRLSGSAQVIARSGQVAEQAMQRIREIAAEVSRRAREVDAATGSIQRSVDGASRAAAQVSQAVAQGGRAMPVLLDAARGAGESLRAVQEVADRIRVLLRSSPSGPAREAEVAGELNELTQQCRRACWDGRGHVDDVREKGGELARLLEQTEHTLARIVELQGEVGRSGESQRRAAARLGEGVSELDAVGDRLATSVQALTSAAAAAAGDSHHTKEAASELASTAERLARAAGQFQLAPLAG